MAGVKVRKVLSAVPSPVFDELTGIVTLPVGWVLSATEKLAEPPASVVVVAEGGLTTNPGIMIWLENSEVDPKFRRPKSAVAVAEIELPAGTLTGNVTLKLPPPNRPVVTEVEPRYTRPSPCPLGSFSPGLLL